MTDKGRQPALGRQEGGNHYQGFVIQPVEYIHKNKLGWLEGTAIKHITRHRSKNGAEDIKKAIHYLEMLLEFDYPEPQPGPLESKFVEDLVADEKRAGRLCEMCNGVGSFQAYKGEPSQGTETRFCGTCKGSGIRWPSHSPADLRAGHVHVLYQKGDVGLPDSIQDSNGDVVLGLCKVCGRGELELEYDGGVCPGRRGVAPNSWHVEGPEEWKPTVTG